MSEKKLNSSNFPLENQQTPYLQVFLYYLHFIQGSNPQIKHPFRILLDIFLNRCRFFSQIHHTLSPFMNALPI